MNGRHWSQKEDVLIRAMFPDLPARIVALWLGRSLSSVYGRAHFLKIAKSEKFLASANSGRINLSAGKSFRFRPGQKPWNAGKRFIAGGRSAETRFSAGHLPHNHKPIGAERIIDGILQRKVTDTRNTKSDWVGVHTILWREAGREIPDGMFLVFKDRNPQNITLENLELVDRAGLMARNSIQRYPAELKSTIRLVGKLKRKIADREKQNH